MPAQTSQTSYVDILREQMVRPLLRFDLLKHTLKYRDSEKIESLLNLAGAILTVSRERNELRNTSTALWGGESYDELILTFGDRGL